MLFFRVYESGGVPISSDDGCIPTLASLSSTSGALMRWQVLRKFWHLMVARVKFSRFLFLYITILSFTSLHPCVCQSITLYDFQFLQLYHKVRLIKVAWYWLRVKNMHFGSSSEPSGL